MASKEGVGCFGAIAVIVVFSMLISVIVVLVGVTAVLAGLAGAGWLAYSAIGDLGARRTLGEGVNPLQVTGARAHQIAQQEQAAAREALSTTLTSWENLSITCGIGTPLQDNFDQVARGTIHNLEFQDTVLRAQAAYSNSSPPLNATAQDLARSTIAMDQLTEELRIAIHRASER